MVRRRALDRCGTEVSDLSTFPRWFAASAGALARRRRQAASGWLGRVRSEARRRCLLVPILVIGLLLASVSEASPNWYLELPADLVNETAARRTLALELREMEVPADPLREGDQARFVQLHVSVSPEAPQGEAVGPDFLVVEVWDRGQSAGRRRVSAHGHPSTVGRRVALAAVELVRQLATQRRMVLEEQQERERQAEEVARIRAAQAARRRLALGARSSLVAFPEGGWLVGPGLEVELNSQLPFRLRAALDYRLGSLRMGTGQQSDSFPWSQFEASVAALWTWQWRRSEIDAGLSSAVSAIHLAGGLETESLTGLSDTWSARLGGVAGGLVPLGDWGRLRLGVSLGAVLRRVPYGRDGVESSLGGVFLGTEVSLLLRP